ncbi:MAG: ribosomal protein S18 acetylase RimI-like enzyme [Flavobacterium sp.]|jgi:ribosomal protein S18 acetylase RimI-like enzyme
MSNIHTKTLSIIRAFCDEDSADLVRIHDLARPIELEGSCDPRAFVPLLTDKEDLAEFNASQKFIATINNQTVGFIGIDQDTIGWLYIDPSLARKGLGRKLLQYALSQINGASLVYVLDGNEPAINLYQSEGFSVIENFKSQNNNYPCRVLKLSRKNTKR